MKLHFLRAFELNKLLAMALFRGKDLKPKREIFLPELILDATGQRRRQQRAQNVKNCRKKIKMILTDPILVLRQEQKKDPRAVSKIFVEHTIQDNAYL